MWRNAARLTRNGLNRNSGRKIQQRSYRGANTCRRAHPDYCRVSHTARYAAACAAAATAHSAIALSPCALAARLKNKTQNGSHSEAPLRGALVRRTCAARVRGERTGEAEQRWPPSAAVSAKAHRALGVCAHMGEHKCTLAKARCARCLRGAAARYCVHRARRGVPRMLRESCAQAGSCASRASIAPARWHA